MGLCAEIELSVAFVACQRDVHEKLRRLRLPSICRSQESVTYITDFLSLHSFHTSPLFYTFLGIIQSIFGCFLIV